MIYFDNQDFYNNDDEQSVINNTELKFSPKSSYLI